MAGKPLPGDEIIVRVRAQPRASRRGIQGVRDGRLVIRTTAAPADGKANADLVRQLAGEFGVPRSSVILTSGATQRNKTFRIRRPAIRPPWLAELAVKP